MKITGALLAAGLAGVAAAAGRPDMLARDPRTALDIIMQMQPPVMTPPNGGIPDDWPGPWFPDGNPFHSGLDADGVCWYWTNLATTFADMLSASYEADITNTVYFANFRGPWKFLERGYYLLAQALMTFEAQLLITNEFRQPADQAEIITCHQTAVTAIAAQVAVLQGRFAQAAGEPYIPIAICMSQRAFALSYLTLANVLANHFDDATLRAQFQSVAGALWTNAGSAAAGTLINTLIASLTIWCGGPP